MCCVFHSAASVGQLQPLMMNIDKCKFNECVPLGLNTDLYPGRGIFSAGTAFFEPYCSKYNFYLCTLIPLIKPSFLKTKFL